MKRLAPAPGARKLNLAGVRRRRVPISEWERRDVHERIVKNGLRLGMVEVRMTGVECMLSEVRHELRRRHGDHGLWARCIALGIIGLSPLAVAAIKALFP